NWLIHQNSMLQPQASRRPRRTDSLTELIHDECIRLASTRQRTELLFDYWLTGTRHPELRQVMRTAVRRYRQGIPTLATAALRGHRGDLPGITADAISGAAVSFIHGCAMQAVIDPQHFDVHEALAVMGVITQRRTKKTR